MKRLRATFIVSPKLKNCCIYKHFKNNALLKTHMRIELMLCIKLEVSHVSKDLLLIFKLEQINGLIVVIYLKKGLSNSDYYFKSISSHGKMACGS